MSCTGIQIVNPVCHAKDIVNHVGSDAFSKIAEDAGQAAAQAADWLWRQLNEATSVNLADTGIRRDLLITGAIAGVLCIGLFLIQMITAALRREPGALARGLRGLVVATAGSSFAIATTNIALAVVDQLSAGVVQTATGTDMSGLGGKFAIAAGLGTVSNPFILVGVAMIVLLAVIINWGAMMVRKLLIIVSAVMAPLAFSGSAADITRAWVRRWIEFTAALIVSKLVLAIVLMIGLSVLRGAGQNGSGVTQTGTQLLEGALILLLGGFAPWIAIKMVHFVGDSFQSVHAQSVSVRAGASTAMAVPQKAARLSSGVAGGIGMVASKAGAAGSAVAAKPPASSTGSGAGSATGSSDRSSAALASSSKERAQSSVSVGSAG